MELSADRKEEARYASLIASLKSNDEHDFEDALDEAVYVAGAMERKPYQNKLLDTVLSKIEEGPSTETRGWQIKFVRDLGHRISGHAESTDFLPGEEALDRIAAMGNANIGARKIALEILFDVPHLRVTAKTIQTIELAFQSKNRNTDRSFEMRAIDLGIKYAQEFPRSRLEPGTPQNLLYKLITDQLIQGNLPEGRARSFVRDLKREWDGDEEITILEGIRDSQNLPKDIRDIARNALQK